MVDRTQVLSQMPGVEYVLVFENRGSDVGVTLHHPHGQIYAYPFIPPKPKRSLDAAARYRTAHDRCLFCDVLNAEIGGWTAHRGRHPQFRRIRPLRRPLAV